MKGIIRRLRPSPAMVVACIALMFAMTGAGYAAGMLGPNTVGTKQLKKNAVISSKVKNRSLLAVGLQGGPAPAGRAGHRARGRPRGTRSRGAERVPQGLRGSAGSRTRQRRLGLVAVDQTRIRKADLGPERTVTSRRCQALTAQRGPGFTRGADTRRRGPLPRAVATSCLCGTRGVSAPSRRCSRFRCRVSDRQSRDSGHCTDGRTMLRCCELAVRFTGRGAGSRPQPTPERVCKRSGSLSQAQDLTLAHEPRPIHSSPPT